MHVSFAAAEGRCGRGPALTAPVGSDVRAGEELRLDYGEEYWKGHSQEDTTSMDVDGANESQIFDAVVIEQRPSSSSSRTRRKPGPGRDSEYIPEIEEGDDGF